MGMGCTKKQYNQVSDSTNDNQPITKEKVKNTIFLTNDYENQTSNGAETKTSSVDSSDQSNTEGETSAAVVSSPDDENMVYKLEDTIPEESEEETDKEVTKVITVKTENDMATLSLSVSDVSEYNESPSPVSLPPPQEEGIV